VGSSFAGAKTLITIKCNSENILVGKASVSICIVNCKISELFQPDAKTEPDVRALYGAT
jgi:hypothetical protein